MADQVELYIKGRVYRGWTDIQITSAIDAIAGAFSISLTERWAGDGRTPSQIEAWPILNGDPCQIKIDGELVVNGYVDQFRPSFSATSHTIEIQGRDKTCDLVDCTAYHEPDQWTNLTLLQIAQIICKPFGIPVRADVDVGEKFPTIKLQQGETAFSALDRLARFRTCLLTPDIGGGLLITRAGTMRAGMNLQQGVNIISGSGNLDTSQRFSLYVVKSQTASSPAYDLAPDDGDDNSPIEVDGGDDAQTIHVEAKATDSGVTRYRPMVVVAETGSTSMSATARATWEANMRLGRSASAAVTVRGWRQGTSERSSLWRPNLLVHVLASFLRMDGDMLIRQVTYRRTPSEGTVCDLDLVSPQAFSPEPPDKEKEKRAQKGGRDIWREALGDEPST
jgi:prophage tail gpP-like protein